MSKVIRISSLLNEHILNTPRRNIFVDRHFDSIFEGVAPRPQEPLMAPTVPANRKRDFDPKEFLATDGFRIFKMKRVQI